MATPSNNCQIQCSKNSYMVEVDVAGGNVTAKAFYKPGSSVRNQYPQSGDGDDTTINTGAATGYGSATATTQAVTVSTANTHPETVPTADMTTIGSISTASNPKFNDQSMSTVSENLLNATIFTKDPYKLDHVLLFPQDGGNIQIAKVDDINHITKIYNPNDESASIPFVSDKYKKIVPIHVPNTDDKIIVEYGQGNKYIIDNMVPGDFTYKYTLSKNMTIINAPFDFFEIFPVTTVKEQSGDDTSVDGIISVITPGGGRLKRRTTHHRSRRTRNRRIRRIRRKSTKRPRT